MMVERIKKSMTRPKINRPHNNGDLAGQLQQLLGGLARAQQQNTAPAPQNIGQSPLIGHNNPPAEQNPENFDPNSPEIISNLAVSYDAREDRLILRAGTSQFREFRFYVTYRLYRLLLGMFNQIEDAAIDPNIPEVSKEAVREFQREKTLQGTNFNEKIAEEKTYTPIFGETPLLIDKIEAKVTNKLVQFVITTQKQVTSLPLPRETATALRHMLNQSATRAEWENNPIYQNKEGKKDDKPTPVILN